MGDGSQRLRELRRTPLIEEGAWPSWPEGLDSDPRVWLPHRPPMLLVDRLVGADLDRGILVGQRLITDDHIGLAGHFPGDPVLPGTLALEMLGQVGVALFQMLLQEEPGGQALSVRATKILGAHFLRPLGPGDRVDLVVQAGDYDTFLGECLAQALVDGQVSAALVGEVMVL